MRILIIAMVLLLAFPLVNATYNPLFSNVYGNEIQGQSSKVTNIPIILNGTGVNTAGLISAGLLQADCDDLIFVNESDNYMLPYIWESRFDENYGCNTGKSIIWGGQDAIFPSNKNQSFVYINNIGANNQGNWTGLDVFKWQGFLYLFGVNGSTTAHNLLNSSRNGTISGTSIFYKELIGNALNFTGTQTTGTYINSTLSDFNKTANFSIGFWIDYVAQDRTGEGSIIYSHWDGGISTRQHLQLSVTDTSNNGKGLREFNVIYHTDDNCNGASVVRNAFNFTNYTRNFIVVVFNESSDVNIYLNGQLNKSYLETRSICGFWRPESSIGKLSYDNIRQLSSALDFFFIINQTLSANEVKALYEITNNSLNHLTLTEYVPPAVTWTPIYNATATEGTTQTIWLNVTYDPLVYIDAVASLEYDGAQYSTTEITNTGNSLFYKTLQLGGVSTPTAKTFKFLLTFTDGSSQTYLNTSDYTQTINPVGSINVTSQECFDRAYYFDFQDEQNFTSLYADVNYRFYYGINNGTSEVIFGNFSNIANFSLCINSTSSPTWTIGSGEIQYLSDGYVQRRYYIFDDTQVTNVTNNVTLYNLLSAEQTSFRFQAEDTSLIPYQDKYFATLRWYPQINQYKIVEMGLTDNLGTSVMHVETENTDYRVALYHKDGTLIKLADPSRFLCLVNPCTYVLRVPQANQDYFSYYDIQYNFAFDKTLKLFVFTYNDMSQRTQTMNLTIYKETGSSSFAVCSSFATGYIGILRCNVTAFGTGTYRGVVTRMASPPVTIATLTEIIDNFAFNTRYGLFMIFLIGVPIILFLAYVSPFASIIGVILTLIPALYLNVFGGATLTIFGAIIVLGFIIIHTLKRASP